MMPTPRCRGRCVKKRRATSLTLNIRAQPMAYYAVFVEGNNFELSLDGRKERLGFFHDSAS